MRVGLEPNISKTGLLYIFKFSESVSALNNSAVVAPKQRIRGSRWLSAPHSGAAHLLLKVNMPPAGRLLTGPLRGIRPIQRLPGLKAPAAGPQLAEFLRCNIHFRKGEHLRTAQASAAVKRTAGSATAANAERRRIACRSLAVVVEHVRRRKLDMSAVIAAGRRRRERHVAPTAVGRRRRGLMVPGMQKRLPRRQICRTVCKVASRPTADAAVIAATLLAVDIAVHALTFCIALIAVCTAAVAAVAAAAAADPDAVVHGLKSSSNQAVLASSC
jgi:hypothetical protein